MPTAIRTFRRRNTVSVFRISGFRRFAVGIGRFGGRVAGAPKRPLFTGERHFLGESPKNFHFPLDSWISGKTRFFRKIPKNDVFGDFFGCADIGATLSSGPDSPAVKASGFRAGGAGFEPGSVPFFPLWVFFSRKSGLPLGNLTAGRSRF